MRVLYSSSRGVVAIEKIGGLLKYGGELVVRISCLFFRFPRGRFR